MPFLSNKFDQVIKAVFSSISSVFPFSVPSKKEHRKRRGKYFNIKFNWWSVSISQWVSNSNCTVVMTMKMEEMKGWKEEEEEEDKTLLIKIIKKGIE